jgi:hypothetical protein
VSFWIATSYYLEAFLGVPIDEVRPDFPRPLWGPSYDVLTQPPLARYVIGVERRLGGFGVADLNGTGRVRGERSRGEQAERPATSIVAPADGVACVPVRAPSFRHRESLRRPARRLRVRARVRLQPLSPGHDTARDGGSDSDLLRDSGIGRDGFRRIVLRVDRASRNGVSVAIRPVDLVASGGALRRLGRRDEPERSLRGRRSGASRLGRHTLRRRTPAALRVGAIGAVGIVLGGTVIGFIAPNPYLYPGLVPGPSRE